MPYYLDKAIFTPSTGSNSLGLGLNTLANDSTGSNNLAVGVNAGSLITTGSNNLIVGYNAASTTLATGSNNIVIGTSSSADVASASTSNTLWVGGGATAVLSATAINGTPVVTVPGSLVVTGSLTHNGGSLQAPVAVGATLAVTAAMSGSALLLNTATGSVATLPAATGSGATYKFIVTTTASSNKHAILAASSADFVSGNATGHVSAGTTLTFSAISTTMHSVQMPFAGTQPSGGFIGDWFTFTDVAANLWAVAGQYQSGTTSTTPFSTATS